MPAPLAKGLIIAASVIVAAGIAIYESPQVRQWVDQSRRKIAVALHSLGDEIQPRRPSESEDEFELRKRKRRNDLIRKAREEGVSVDLDELAKIGEEEDEAKRQRRRGFVPKKSFDELVGSDGMLKDQATTKTATGTETQDKDLRRRGVAGVAGFAAGAATAAVVANPFSDDNILFDHDEEEAQSPKPFNYVEPGTRESSATLEGDHVSPPVGDMIDLTPESVYLQPEDPQTASIPQSVADEQEYDQNAQSFYSFASHADDEPEHVSTGTLTPRSTHSAFASTSASVVGSHASDIGILSMQNDSDHDARSETFSESGFTEAGFSEAGFSEVGEDRAGVMTPSSWTDVGSDDESEWGGAAVGGYVSQVQLQMQSQQQQ